MNRFLCLLLCVSGGCATDGALEQVSFDRECADGDDSCLAGGIDRPIAVGAVLAVDTQTTIAGSATPTIELIAADPTLVKVAGDELVGLAPGRTALLALTDQGQALDFTHLWVAEPTRLALARRDRDGDQSIDAPIQLLVGDELELELVAFAGSSRLSGRLAADWSASSEIVSVLSDGQLGARRLVARSPGTVSIEVASGPGTASLEIEVVP